jgi:hypothetical protein
MNALFKILSNSSFISHPTIRRSSVCDTESVVKLTTNLTPHLFLFIFQLMRGRKAGLCFFRLVCPSVVNSSFLSLFDVVVTRYPCIFIILIKQLKLWSSLTFKCVHCVSSSVLYYQTPWVCITVRGQMLHPYKSIGNIVGFMFWL